MSHRNDAGGAAGEGALEEKGAFEDEGALEEKGAFEDEGALEQQPGVAGEDEHRITRLLHSWSGGDPQALERLMPLVFDELRRVARGYFVGERRDHTLQPTALVNEVFLQLLNRRQVSWKNRSQFFGFAAQLMRRTLVDHARRRQAEKRGGDVTVVALDEARVLGARQEVSLLALDDALKDLETLDPEGSRVVEMRFFAGLTHDEIASIMDVPAIRVRRLWTAAKLWLYRQLAAGGSVP